jgi:hypothetical protein
MESIVVSSSYSIRCEGRSVGRQLSWRVSEAKKCGVEIGDPNLRFQPRLPGSVVGEASMGQVEKADKITGVTVLW